MEWITQVASVVATRQVIEVQQADNKVKLLGQRGTNAHYSPSPMSRPRSLAEPAAALRSGEGGRGGGGGDGVAVAASGTAGKRGGSFKGGSFRKLKKMESLSTGREYSTDTFEGIDEGGGVRQGGASDAAAAGAAANVKSGSVDPTGSMGRFERVRVQSVDALTFVGPSRAGTTCQEEHDEIL